MMKSFNGGANVAVIGASGGIGKAVVKLLNDDPGVARIHAFSRSAARSRDGKIVHLPMDILDEVSIPKSTY